MNAIPNPELQPSLARGHGGLTRAEEFMERARELGVPAAGSMSRFLDEARLQEEPARKGGGAVSLSV